MTSDFVFCPLLGLGFKSERLPCSVCIRFNISPSFTSAEVLEKRKQISLKDNTYRTLSSGVNLTYPETIRKKIGEIDTAKLDDAKRYFSDIIRGEKNENSIVIQKNGQVIHFIGEKAGLSIWDVDYNGATIIHNHPTSEGMVSFGEDDFFFLRENQEIDELVAVNVKYDYSVQVLKDISKLTYNDLQKWALPYVFMGEEMQHASFLALDEKGFVKYEKRKINK